MDLISQSAALLEATPQRWRGLTAAADPLLLAREPRPGEWSALGCLQHLLDTEEHVFPVRVRAFLAGHDFPAFDPDAEGTLVGEGVDAARIVERFASLRGESVALLRTLRETDLARTARHAELGPVTLEQLLNQWAGHDLMHTVQGERALMQAFIPATGPWRSFFADHDVLRTT
jgi:hypothetical protein